MRNRSVQQNKMLIISLPFHLTLRSSWPQLYTKHQLLCHNARVYSYVLTFCLFLAHDGSLTFLCALEFSATLRVLLLLFISWWLAPVSWNCRRRRWICRKGPGRNTANYFPPTSPEAAFRFFSRALSLWFPRVILKFKYPNRKMFEERYQIRIAGLLLQLTTSFEWMLKGNGAVSKVVGAVVYRSLSCSLDPKTQYLNGERLMP